MFMCGWFPIDMKIVFAYVIGSQAIRQQVMRPSGMFRRAHTSALAGVLRVAGTWLVGHAPSQRCRRHKVRAWPVCPLSWCDCAAVWWFTNGGGGQ